MENLAAWLIREYPATVQLLEKFAPGFIALIALIVTAWIQIGQKIIARHKLKLDLFKERYELLNIIRNMIKLSNKNTDEFLFEMSKEYDRFRQYGLLFPKRIANKVDKLVECCYEYQGLRQETNDMRGSSEMAEANKKFRASQIKLELLFLDLQKEVAGFIRVDWKE
jgi:hypothetical protein